MRCKKHYTDLSSTVGVCACCLRERLLPLVAAEEQALAQVQNLGGKHRNSENIPAIPRSVSPYIHNRRRNQSDGAVVCSDNIRRTEVTEHQHHLHHLHRHPYPSAASHHRHSLSDQLFDRTPEVGVSSGGDNTGVDSNKNRRFARFVSFNIFRSRNRKSVDSVSDLSESDSTLRQQCGGGNRISTSSPSWISSIVHGSRHRRKPPVFADESTVTAAGGDGDGAPRRLHCRDRGMSPVRNSDVDDGDVAEHESTVSWKNTPRRTPARRGGGGAHGRNLSGLTFCLSPLVRASPNRRRNHNGMPPDGVFSGEIRAPVKPHLANTKSFHANRSRKLVDLGRCNHNR